MACTARLRAVAAALLVAGCDAATAPDGALSGDEGSPRPGFHFTPPANWMNDPNGLVFYEGEYHLFYQHNPKANTWGNIGWGHAVSRDLVSWEHLPVALPEARGFFIFSGSAVVDWNNTSGFGSGGRPPLVAIYTAHEPLDHRQRQEIAYSTDRGRTWTKYAGNPVLDLGAHHFRDPKVFWYEPDRRWIMVIALSYDPRVRFYASKDLKEWTHLSDFGPAGSTQGQWECPDLFALPLDGNPEDLRWVLEVDVTEGAPAGGGGGQYFVGRFDGTTFTAEAAGRPRWVDYGRDFYASTSWSDVPASDGRRVWTGWMSNWHYAPNVPTRGWRGSLSLPRTVELRTIGGEPRLVQQPVAELRSIRGAGVRLAPQPIAQGGVPLADQGVSGDALEIIAEFEAGTATEFGLKVRMGAGQETVIGVDPRAGNVFVDRTRSGKVDFDPTFAGRHAGPLSQGGGRVRLHVFVDRWSVEVFAGGGETVITDQIFPADGSNGVELYARGGDARLVSLEAWTLGTAGESSSGRAAAGPVR